MSPQERVKKTFRVREADDSGNATVRVVYFHAIADPKATAAARLRGLMILVDANLGFRCAPPQALCYRLLRRLVAFVQRT